MENSPLSMAPMVSMKNKRERDFAIAAYPSKTAIFKVQTPIPAVSSLFSLLSSLLPREYNINRSPKGVLGIQVAKSRVGRLFSLHITANMIDARLLEVGTVQLRQMMAHFPSLLVHLYPNF